LFGTTPVSPISSGPLEGARQPQRRTLTTRPTSLGATALVTLFVLLSALPARAQESGSSEAHLVVPKLNDTSLAAFFGQSGWALLMVGFVVCALGLGFGLMAYGKLKNLPVHKSMLEV